MGSRGRSKHMASLGAAALALGTVAACASHHAAGAAGPSTAGAASSATPSGVSPTPSTATSRPGSDDPPSRGAEGVVAGQGPPCQLASSDAVRESFSAGTVTYVARTSPTGKPLCVFTVRESNIGGATGTVSMTLDAGSSAKAFAAARRQVAGATPLPGVGDVAIYVNATGTVEFLKGHSAVVVQATFSLGAGTQYAARIRTDVVGLAKVVAAQL